MALNPMKMLPVVTPTARGVFAAMAVGCELVKVIGRNSIRLVGTTITVGSRGV